MRASNFGTSGAADPRSTNSRFGSASGAVSASTSGASVVRLAATTSGFASPASVSSRSSNPASSSSSLPSVRRGSGGGGASGPASAAGAGAGAGAASTSRSPPSVMLPSADFTAVPRRPRSETSPMSIARAEIRGRSSVARSNESRAGSCGTPQLICESSSFARSPDSPSGSAEAWNLELSASSAERSSIPGGR